MLLSSQFHARFHGAAMLAVIALGLFLHLSRMEWCLVIFAITGVWVSEAFNTALEFLADRVSMELHPLIGKAKDVAAAAVLIAALGATVVGILVFAPKLWHRVF